jgi:hypothetical protein
MEIKNFDKLRTDSDRQFVKAWSKITTVTINDSGLYMLDMIPDPGFSGAYMVEHVEQHVVEINGQLHSVSNESILIGDTAVHVYTGNVRECKNNMDELIMNNDLSGPAGIGKVWFKISSDDKSA